MRSGGMMLSLLESAARDPPPARRARRGAASVSLFSRLEESTDVQERVLLPRRRGRARTAPRVACAKRCRRRAEAIEVRTERLGISRQAVKQGIVEALEAALALGDSRESRGAARADRGAAARSAAAVPRAHRRSASAARLARRSSRASTPRPSGSASSSIPFWLAVTLLEHGELTGDAVVARRGARDLRATSRRRPWLERLDAVAPTRAEVPA